MTIVKTYKGGGSAQRATTANVPAETYQEAATRIQKDLWNKIKNEYGEKRLGELPTFGEVSVYDDVYNNLYPSLRKVTVRGVSSWQFYDGGEQKELDAARNRINSALGDPVEYAKNQLAGVYKGYGDLSYYGKQNDDAAAKKANNYIPYLIRNGVSAEDINNLFQTNVQLGFNEAVEKNKPDVFQEFLATVLPIAVANILAPGLGSALGSAALGTGAATAIVTGMTTGDLEKALASGLLAGTISHLTTPTATQIPEGGADLYADLADAYEATRGADLFTVQDDLVAQGTPSPVEPAIQTRSYETELPVEVTEGAGPVEYEVLTDRITEPSYGYDYGYGPGEGISATSVVDPLLERSRFGGDLFMTGGEGTDLAPTSPGAPSDTNVIEYGEAAPQNYGRPLSYEPYSGEGGSYFFEEPTTNIYEGFEDLVQPPTQEFGENIVAEPTTDIYQGFEDLVPPPTQEFGVGMDELPPVVDRSIAYDPTVPDTPLGEAIQDLAGAVGEYAINNPLQTAAMLSGAASLASSSGGAEESSPTPVRRVYTYGTAPPIRRTGLQELYSAAADIYGNEEPVVRPQPVTEPPAFEYTPLPVLSEAAPGGGQYGLGSLARTSQMAAPEAFEIGNLTPQQIAMIQQMMTNPVRGETR